MRALPDGWVLLEGEGPSSARSPRRPKLRSLKKPRAPKVSKVRARRDRHEVFCANLYAKHERGFRVTSQTTRLLEEYVTARHDQEELAEWLTDARAFLRASYSEYTTDDWTEDLDIRAICTATDLQSYHFLDAETEDDVESKHELDLIRDDVERMEGRLSGLVETINHRFDAFEALVRTLVATKTPAE